MSPVGRAAHGRGKEEPDGCDDDRSAGRHEGGTFLVGCGGQVGLGGPGHGHLVDEDEDVEGSQAGSSWPTSWALRSCSTLLLTDSASLCAEPRWSISRDPRREEYTICTAVTPEDVFTVRTYGDTRSHYGLEPPG